MKKVLFGLVIALTMCGSGYASEYRTNCYFLAALVTFGVEIEARDNV